MIKSLIILTAKDGDNHSKILAKKHWWLDAKKIHPNIKIWRK
jgi:hypothetical protein